MKAAGLVDRLDDLMNPIVVKELRQAVKSRLVVAALLLLLLLQVFILGVFLISHSHRAAADALDFRAGAQVFTVLQGILLGLCMLLVPLYAGGRFAAERSDTNVDLLFISTLRPRSIIAGKFLAAVVLILLIFSACAPFMTFTYLLRGIDLTAILLVLGIDFLAVLGGTQVALFLAAVPANWPVKVLLGLLGIGCLFALFFPTIGGTVELVEWSPTTSVDAGDFWWASLAVTAVVLSFIGLLFVWSVAVVSPPTANRGLLVRLYLLGQWLLLGVGAFLWSYYYPRGGEHGPVFSWLVVGVLLGCVQMLIAVNERETWGNRVARTIPRRPLLRLPAFLLYSGAAGGVLFAVALIGLTILAAAVWQQLFPGFHSADEVPLIAAVMLGIALYAYCYLLSAVFVRRLLLKSRVPALYTWVVAALLVGLGSTVPFMIALAVFQGRIPYSRENPWWLLTNPFASIYDIGENRPRNWQTALDHGTLWFTLAWAVFVTGLNLPWFLRQALAFHAPAAGRRANVPSEKVASGAA